MSIGGSAGFDRQTILASFAEEIQPLLQVIAGAMDSLLERPGDHLAAQVALAELQTVRGAILLLEVPAFEALLASVGEAIELLRDAPVLGADQRTAGRALVDLLLSEGQALARDGTDPTCGARAAALTAQLRLGGIPATAASLDAWLRTLDGDPSPAPEAIAPVAPPPAAPLTPAPNEADPGEIEGSPAPLVEPMALAAGEEAPSAEAIARLTRPSDPDATTEETLPPPVLRRLLRDGLPPPTASPAPAAEAPDDLPEPVARSLPEATGRTEPGERSAVEQEGAIEAFSPAPNSQAPAPPGAAPPEPNLLETPAAPLDAAALLPSTEEPGLGQAPSVEENDELMQALQELVGPEGLEWLARADAEDTTLALTPPAGPPAEEPPPAETEPPRPEADTPVLPPAPSPILEYLSQVSATVEALLGPGTDHPPAAAAPGAGGGDTEEAITAAECPALAGDEGPAAATEVGVAGTEPAATVEVPDAAPVPAGVGNAAALAVFAAERQRLAERLHEACVALAAAPHDESALTELAWAAHTLRGAALLVGAQVLGEVCTLIERVAEEAEVAGLPITPETVAFLANADETVQWLVSLPPDTPAPREPLDLLAEQFADLARAVSEAPTPAPAPGWGDLPPEIVAQLDGVDLATLDDETVARLYAQVEPEAPSLEPPPTAIEAEGPRAESALPEAADAVAPQEMLPPGLELVGDPAAWAWPAAGSSDAAEAAAESAVGGAALEAALEVELRAVFAAEAEEHLATINRALVAFEAAGDPAQLLEVRRAVHTLKGAAGAVGLEAVVHLCHVWEDVLDAVAEQGASAPPVALLMDCAEALERYLREPAGGDAAGFEPLIAQLRAVAPRPEGLPGALDEAASEEVEATALAADDTLTAPTSGAMAAGEESPAAELHAPVWPPPLAPEVAAEPASEAPAAVATEPAAPADLLRVPLGRVDALIGLVGELVVQRSGVLQRLTALAARIDDLTPSLQRLRRLSLEMEDRFGYASDEATQRTRWAALVSGSAHDFDALEFDRYSEAYQLARELGELAADLETTRRELRHLLEEARLAVEREGRVTADLHAELLDVRLVPLAQLAPRLQRTVRQAALKAHKQVRFVLEGGEAQLDKSLLEELADPLLHLLRNAVDHGIEPAAERERRGKDPVGTVTVRAARTGHEVLVQVCDDGAGIDAARVLARARERGLISPDAADDPMLAHELIFAPGLSTSAEVTGLSGRGIGLDVVRAQLNRAKGTVSVVSTPGEGTVFTLRVPALLVVAPALVVLAGGQRVAVPLAQVRRVLRASPAQRLVVGGVQLLQLDDGARPLRGLAELLGWPAAPVAEAPGLTVLLIAAGDHEAALQVDDIVGQQEVVIKAPAPPFDVLPGLAGASVQGDGTVLPVINPLELLSGGRIRTRVAQPAPLATTAPAASSGAPLALVVDDSLSVRRVVSRMLERHGWRVQEARDGLQALELVRQEPPDVLLLDVEMPRMDGYELASLLKKPGPYQAIPIVMLTSRAGEKHRRKAFELGVDAYLVKPYQEAELVRVLREVALATPWDAA